MAFELAGLGPASRRKGFTVQNFSDNMITMKVGPRAYLKDNLWPLPNSRSDPIKRILIALLGLLLVVPLSCQNNSLSLPAALLRAHSHNDYEHKRPLFDALENGFASIEADIWLGDGELLVGHHLLALHPTRTLQTLYLNPLRDMIQRNRGRVYPGWPQITLLVDIKTDAQATYPVLRNQLLAYQDMLTSFSSEKRVDGPVVVIISGNRPLPMLREEEVRLAACDGRITDLGLNHSVLLMPLISDRWTKYFTWNGTGPMPEAEREKLQQFVNTAHAEGRRIRFWDTSDQISPEREAVWWELIGVNVDLINTDNLEALRQFLENNDT